MVPFRKSWQRLSDPVFYRKFLRDFIRSFRSFDDEPETVSTDFLGKVHRALVFVAHPDDETFCSGLICNLVDSGVEVDVLCLTKGEGGPTGGALRADLGRIREEEMRKSCAALGVSQVHFLDHVDPVAGEFRVYAPAVSPRALADQIAPFLLGSDLLVSHGSSGEYWHPAHLLVHAAAKIAATREDLEWLTFLARHPDHPIQRLVNQDDPIFLCLDVSDLRDRRWAALSNHVSQHGLFARMAKGTAEDFISKTTFESFCRVKDRENGK